MPKGGHVHTMNRDGKTCGYMPKGGHVHTMNRNGKTCGYMPEGGHVHTMNRAQLARLDYTEFLTPFFLSYNAKGRV